MEEAVIKDRVTHVFLYNFFTDQDPKPGAFKGINQSYLPELMAAPGLAAGPGSVPGAGEALGGAGAMSGRDSWTPLTSAGGMSSPGAGPSGGSSMASVLSKFTREGGGSRMAMGDSGFGGGGMRSPAAPALPPGVKPPKPRTEFIVIFFWREPTPSDQLMNLTTAPAGGGTTPTGAGP
jgi:hypothetical protein